MVEGSTDALIGLTVELERIALLQRLEHGNAVVGRTIVNDDDFEVLVVLSKNALNRDLKKSLGVVARGNDGNQRAGPQVLTF